MTAKASSLIGLQSIANVSSPVGVRSRKSFSQAIRYLLDHRIPVLLMYGDGDFRLDLESELDRGLRDAIEKAGPPTRLVTVREHVEGCASLDAQDALLKGIVPWLQDLPELSRLGGRIRWISTGPTSTFMSETR